MKYSLDWLLENSSSTQTFKYLFFWGHQPSKSGEITSSCFSQWWAEHPFIAKDIEYLSAEHWMMAQKALLFDDHANYEKIIACKTAAEAKKLGREVLNFDARAWELHRSEIVKQGNLHKFSQHPALVEYLLGTNERVLVEASPVDNIWGIGLSADSPNASNPEKWNGLNLLGFALMEVRDELSIKTS